MPRGPESKRRLPLQRLPAKVDWWKTAASEEQTDRRRTLEPFSRVLAAHLSMHTRPEHPLRRKPRLQGTVRAAAPQRLDLPLQWGQLDVPEPQRRPGFLSSQRCIRRRSTARELL